MVGLGCCKGSEPGRVYWVDTLVSTRTRRGCPLADRRILLRALQPSKPNSLVHRDATRPQAMQTSQHVVPFECQREAPLSAAGLVMRVRPVTLAEHEPNLPIIAAHQSRHSRQAASGRGTKPLAR